jgi:hypothetical protein
MMSLCQEFYQFLLAQGQCYALAGDLPADADYCEGFLLGLSMALIVVPAFTTIPRVSLTERLFQECTDKRSTSTSTRV